MSDPRASVCTAGIDPGLDGGLALILPDGAVRLHPTPVLAAGPGGKPRDPCYHLACDTIDNVDLPVLLRMAKTTAAALRELSARHR